MKNLLLLLVLFCGIPHIILSQEPNTIEFKYDEAGNRWLRQAVYIPGMIESDVIQADIVQPVELKKSILADSTVICDVSVNIYPNPTLNKFIVSVSNLSDNDDIQYSLVSLTGSVISRGRLVLSDTEIDMQMCKRGTYIYTIIFNGRSNSWRIIKR